MEVIDESNDNRSLLNSGNISLSWILISMNQIRSSNNPYSKMILIEHTGMNWENRHFEDLEYLHSIITQYLE